MTDDDFNTLKKLQELARRNVATDNKRDSDIKIRMLVLDLTKSTRPIQVEEILTQGELSGIKSNEVRIVIDQLIDEKVLVEPQEGYVQKNIY